MGRVCAVGGTGLFEVPADAQMLGEMAVPYLAQSHWEL
jgi:hypothetical protein